MIQRVRENGIVGAGGAGFPTYKKLERPAEILIMNAAECEPLLHKDKEILHHYTDEVLAGFVAVREHLGAKQAVIGIKGKYEDLIEKLEPKAAALGVQVHRLGDFYPSGDEFITVHQVTGRVIPPGGIPLDVGCLVINVETVLNIHLDQPVTHKFFTVCGAVPRPASVRVPVGTSYREVLTTLGVDVAALGSVLVGGVMMGKRMQSLDEVVTRTTGALVCLPPDHNLGERYAADAHQRDLIGKSACDQCSFCTELCPRYLLGHPVEPHKAMRNLQFHMVPDSLILGSQFCCECNLCSLFACPEDLFPKDACADNKRYMRENKLKHPITGTPTKAHSFADDRHIPLKSLMRRLGLDRFENVGPLIDPPWAPARVRIPLRQHIGEPAPAAVRAGDRVRVGQVIGSAPAGMGVPIHASIDGVVEAVGADVVIRAN